MDVTINALIVLVTAACMEPFAWFMHRYVMHGFGWGWHQSHHQQRSSKSIWFERNDLYALVFASLAIGLIACGVFLFYPLQWVGYGMTLYGLIYFVVHDGMVHQRWPVKWIPRRGYLKSLYQSHRLHHASADKGNAVSLGFLYAASPHRLKQQMQADRLRKNKNLHAPSKRTKKYLA